MSWNDCLNEGRARASTIDNNLAKASLQMSERWLKVISYLPINEITAPIIASNAYEALLEVCNSILAVKGYKSYSHECITYFLNDVLKEEKSSIIFDRNRQLRNGINYYGKLVSPDRAVSALKEIKEQIAYLKNKYLSNNF